MECSKYCSPQPQIFGELHNKGLDYLYGRLLAFKGKTVDAKLGAQMQSRVSTATTEFFKLNLPGMVKVCDEIAQLTTELFYSLDGNLDAIENEVFSKIYFSPTGTQYLNQVREVMAQTLPPAEYQQSLTNIYNDAYASEQLQGRESEQLLTMLQVGIYSSQYWANAENQQKWDDLTGSSGRYWGQVATTDLATAGGACITYAGVVIAGLGTPLGWGAYGATILIAALAGSVTAALYLYMYP